MKILRLTLFSRDISAQQKFYSSILQLPAKMQEDSLQVQAGQTEIVFKAYTTSASTFQQIDSAKQKPGLLIKFRF
jgi:hypothetical protein